MQYHWKLCSILNDILCYWATGKIITFMISRKKPNPEYILDQFQNLINSSTQ